jgi:hypothetical protein
MVSVNTPKPPFLSVKPETWYALASQCSATVTGYRRSEEPPWRTLSQQ